MNTEPTRCDSSRCARWTFNQNGYCSDECAGFAPSGAARGIGIITPPSKVHYSARARVRKSSGYVASNGAWIATNDASYLENAADHRDLDRAAKRHAVAVADSIAPNAAPHHKTAADMRPIGDTNH